jgi:septation ring formation regulator EzrA
MYPDQDESEISASLRDLEAKSRHTISLLQTRLGAIDTQLEREQLSSFLEKWLERLEKESTSWEERRLSVSTLSSALP